MMVLCGCGQIGYCGVCCFHTEYSEENEESDESGVGMPTRRQKAHSIGGRASHTRNKSDISDLLHTIRKQSPSVEQRQSPGMEGRYSPISQAISTPAILRTGAIIYMPRPHVTTTRPFVTCPASYTSPPLLQAQTNPLRLKMKNL